MTQTGMKYVVWGAGIYGYRAMCQLGSDHIMAYLDTNPEKYGTLYLGRRIINFEEYEAKYKKFPIIICFAEPERGEKVLKDKGIHIYFRWLDNPAEYHEQQQRLIFQKYIKGLLEDNMSYLLVGCTVFSLQVYEWVLEHQASSVSLLDDGSVSEEMYSFLRDKGISIVKKSNADRILFCEYLTPEKRGNLKCNEKYIFDCMNEIPDYYNKEVEQLRNSEQGKRCFIIGNGPSLRIEDLELLYEMGEVTFAVNGIVKIFNRTKWRPTYYVVEDQGIFSNENFTWMIDEAEAECMLFSDGYEPFWELDYNKRRVRYHIAFMHSNGHEIDFSEDLAHGSYAASTVIYSCIQWAVYLGFKEIYLYGVDFPADYMEGESVPYRHFYSENEEGAGDATWQRASYKAARKYCDNHGIVICNVARGGELGIFERRCFDSILNSRYKECD